MVSTVVFGSIGSGKSYYLVRYAVNNYKRFSNVVSNFPIFIPNKPVRRWNERYITSGITNTLYLIDEAWALWNSRHFADFDTAVHDWFALSRHYGNDIVLATQAVPRLDKVIREVSQDFVFLRSHKIFRRPIFFSAYHYDCLPSDKAEGGISRPRFNSVFTEHYPFSRRIARCYDTSERNDPSDGFVFTPYWGQDDEDEDEDEDSLEEFPEDDFEPYRGKDE